MAGKSFFFNRRGGCFVHRSPKSGLRYERQTMFRQSACDVHRGEQTNVNFGPSKRCNEWWACWVWRNRWMGLCESSSDCWNEWCCWKIKINFSTSSNLSLKLTEPFHLVSETHASRECQKLSYRHPAWRNGSSSRRRQLQGSIARRCDSCRQKLPSSNHHGRLCWQRRMLCVFQPYPLSRSRHIHQLSVKFPSPTFLRNDWKWKDWMIDISFELLLTRICWASWNHHRPWYRRVQNIE